MSLRRLTSLIIFLLLAAPCWGAWGTGSTNAASAQTKVAGASVTGSIEAGVTIEAGNVLIVAAATDNATTTDTLSTDLSVSDTQSNAYTRACEYTNGNGSAEAGVTTAIFYSKLTTQLSNAASDTITLSSTSSTIHAKTFVAAEFTITAGTTVSVAGSCATMPDDGVDPSAVTISGLTSAEYLWVHNLGAEGPNSDAYTYDADYSAIGSDTIQGSSGGSQSSNAHTRGRYRIFTGTTDTVDHTSTTTDRDYAQVYVALKVTAPPSSTHQYIISQNRKEP